MRAPWPEVADWHTHSYLSLCASGGKSSANREKLLASSPSSFVGVKGLSYVNGCRTGGWLVVFRGSAEKSVVYDVVLWGDGEHIGGVRNLSMDSQGT